MLDFLFFLSLPPLQFYYLQDCYSLIDRNARTILETDEFEDLSHTLMTDIISRDSLCLRDETVICRAIHRYKNSIDNSITFNVVI